MSIVRVARRKRYTVIAQETLNDERLSFRARGVLAWLLDKPDDWRIDRDAIAQAGREGEKAVRAALRELTALGYIVHRKVRDPASGRISTLSTVYECPECDEPDAPTGGQEPASGDEPSPRPVAAVSGAASVAATGGRKQAAGPEAGNRPGGKPPGRKQAAFPKTETNYEDQTPSSTPTTPMGAATDGGVVEEEEGSALQSQEPDPAGDDPVGVAVKTAAYEAAYRAADNVGPGWGSAVRARIDREWAGLDAATRQSFAEMDAATLVDAIERLARAKRKGNTFDRLVPTSGLRKLFPDAHPTHPLRAVASLDGDRGDVIEARVVDDSTTRRCLFCGPGLTECPYPDLAYSSCAFGHDRPRREVGP